MAVVTLRVGSSVWQRRTIVASDALAGDAPLDGVLFVRQRPEDHAGVIAIAEDQGAQLLKNLRRAAGESILGHHEDAEPIAGVERLGRVRIMRRAKGVGIPVP